MEMIATHNSVTGEKGEGILSWLVAPFSKCQSKTLEEQYKVGVRYFDIRIFRDKYGCWRCGHGLWTSKKWYRDILYGFFIAHDDIRYSLTFEKGDGQVEYAKFRETFGDPFNDKKLTYVAAKHPQWRVLEKSDNPAGFVAKYANLDGSTWHTLLPIPWLWKKIYHNHPEFNETYFTMVDFV